MSNKYYNLDFLVSKESLDQETTIDLTRNRPKISERYEYRADNYLWLVCTDSDSGEITDEIRTNRRLKQY